MTKSAAHILYLGMILILFCVIFALLGMETLAQNMVSSNTRLRYDTIYDALINVFIVLSGENWNDLFVEAAAHVGPWAPIYYILVLVLCNWIMLNLFVAILLANINDLSMQEQQEKLKIAKGLFAQDGRGEEGIDEVSAGPSVERRLVPFEDARIAQDEQEWHGREWRLLRLHRHKHRRLVWYPAHLQANGHILRHC